jgi:hypothetical protein
LKNPAAFLQLAVNFFASNGFGCSQGSESASESIV